MKNFFQRRKMLLVSLGGACAMLIILAGVLFVAPLIASAASGNNASTPATTRNTYCAQYNQNLAKSLNVPVSTLTQDRKAAITNVINQMVKDGKLKQARATAIEKRIANSKGTACPKVITAAHKHAYAWLNKYQTNITSSLAQGLHLTSAQLLAQFKAGKNLEQIAKAQNVSTSALTTLVQNTANSVVKQAVSAGTLTQKRATAITTFIQKHPAQIQHLEAAVVKKASKK
ncbi:hypothetical protein [Dictyobacter arantiisoli]|uniref:Uncharacterized protein n=1 Tax=Dictyobacter arantiisoli TaxID=2014874 RepID=A0A5A5TFL3_9CHLR|nr:hypothetical protein [Dictyobacter arantiisoli]GCF09704.1 hypothetical protein KDI_32680 [Dictyobacter arantiisoli]